MSPGHKAFIRRLLSEANKGTDVQAPTAKSQSEADSYASLSGEGRLQLLEEFWTGVVKKGRCVIVLPFCILRPLSVLFARKNDAVHVDIAAKLSENCGNWVKSPAHAWPHSDATDHLATELGKQKEKGVTKPFVHVCGYFTHVFAVPVHCSVL